MNAMYAIKTKAGFSYSIAVMDKFEGWEVGWGPNSRQACRFSQAVICNGQYRAPYFLMRSCCTNLFLHVARVYSHTLTSFPCMAQVTVHVVCGSPKNIHTSSRNVAQFAALGDTTHGHTFLTFSSAE